MVIFTFQPPLHRMMSIIPWLLVTSLGSVWAGSIPGGALNGTLNLAFIGASRIFMPGALPAFNVAMRTIRERKLLPGYNIEWQYRDSQCNPYHGKYHVSMQLKHHKHCDHLSIITILTLPYGENCVRRLEQLK